jgi:prepilin-type N-terminal cleavage/methylation domain-containing protein
MRCRIIPQEKGVTVVELLVAIALLAILLVITVTFYPPVIKVFNTGKDDFDLRSELSTARDVMSNYLTKASTFTVVNQGRINFIANVDVTSPASENCVLYLYNVNDASWPTTYTQNCYELRFSSNTTGLPGFGSGRSIVGDTQAIVLHGLLPPPATFFSSSGNQIAVTLKAIKNAQNFELRFETHPRNL